MKRKNPLTVMGFVVVGGLVAAILFVLLAVIASGQMPGARWLTVDKFSGIVTSPDPRHIPFEAARQVDGWILRAGELRRLKFERMDSDEGVTSSAHFLGQSRGDTSVLVLTDGLKKMHARTGVFTEVDLGSSGVELDTAIAAVTFEYGETFTPYMFDDLLIWSKDFDTIPGVRTSGWLWWAPTTRDYIKHNKGHIPVTQFLSNRWLVADSFATVLGVENSDTLISGQNWYIEADEGTGSYEYWSDADDDGTGEDTTVLMDGSYLWHYVDGELIDAVMEYFEFVEYPAQGKIDYFYIANDTVYAVIDTASTWSFLDYSEKADSTRNVSLGGGLLADACDSMVGMFIIWDDTSIYSRAFACSVLVCDWVADSVRLTLAAPSILAEDDPIHLPDDAFFIGMNMHETNPAGWVRQGGTIGDTAGEWCSAAGAVGSVDTVGPIVEQTIDIQATLDDSTLVTLWPFLDNSDSITSRLSWAWPEVYEEAGYASSGEVWRIRQLVHEAHVSEAPTKDSVNNLNVYGGPDSLYDALSDGSVGTYGRARHISQDSDVDSFWVEVDVATLPSSQFACDSVVFRVTQTANLQVGTPYAFFNGVYRRLFWSRGEISEFDSSGAYWDVYTTTQTSMDNDSLANLRFGIIYGQNSTWNIYELRCDVFYRDTAGIDTGFCYVDSVPTFYLDPYTDTVYAGVSLVAFAPVGDGSWSFAESVTPDSSFIIERTKRIDDWEYVVTDSGATEFTPLRGVTHRRRAWYAQDAGNPMDLVWSDLNLYENTTGNAETLEGNDPLMGLSSYGLQMVGYRRRSILAVTGFDEADFYMQPLPSGVGAASHDVIHRSSRHDVDVFCNEQGLWTMDGSRVSRIGESSVEMFEDSINWEEETKLDAAIYEDQYFLAAPFGENTENSHLAVYDIDNLQDVGMTFYPVPPVASLWTYEGAEGEEVLFMGALDSGVVWKVEGATNDLAVPAEYVSGWYHGNDRVRGLRYEVIAYGNQWDSLFFDFYADYEDDVVWSDTVLFTEEALLERYDCPRAVQGKSLSYGIRANSADIIIESFSLEIAPMGDRRR